jgi:TolB-like protein
MMECAADAFIIELRRWRRQGTLFGEHHPSSAENYLAFLTHTLPLMMKNFNQKLHRRSQTMNIRRNVRLFSGFLFLLLVLVAALPTSTWAAAQKATDKPGKIIFLPFTVTTQPPQEHLRAGLTSILATRLEERTGLDAVHGADKTGGLEQLLQQGRKEEIRTMLRNLHGEYLLAGSLEQQKDGYEILLHVFSGAKAAPASFSRKIDSIDKALTALDELSGEIAAKVFRKLPNGEEEPLPTAAVQGDKAVSFQTEHPDKAWRDGLYAAAEGHPAAATVSSINNNSPFTMLTAQTSGELELSLRAMDAGDLDSDGREELVLLEQGRLLLSRFSADRFQQIAELQLPAHLAYHALHVTDMNGDHRPEICISASNGNLPSSLVLAWDGKQFHTLYDQVPFYLRPDVDSAGKSVLLGQAGHNIYRMIVNPAGNLVRAEEVHVPQGFGLYDFIRVDLDGDGRRELVGLSEDNKLVVLNQDGTVLWKSEEIYGASRDALGTLASRRQAELEHPYDRERLYIHTRIVAQDLTGDGKPEIIIGRNRVTSVKYFKSLRWFEGSSAAVLSWDGSAMHTLWETSQTPGYMVDCQVLPSAEQPGRFRLFTAESNDSGNPLYFWAKEKTVIKMQELSMPGGRR